MSDTAENASEELEVITYDDLPSFLQKAVDAAKKEKQMFEDAIALKEEKENDPLFDHLDFEYYGTSGSRCSTLRQIVHFCTKRQEKQYKHSMIMLVNAIRTTNGCHRTANEQLPMRAILDLVDQAYPHEEA